MSLLTRSMELIRKYGKAAKVVVLGVLNVVAPGSGTLLDTASKVLNEVEKVADDAQQNLEKTQRERWEKEVLARLGQSQAELEHLETLFEFLLGPLEVLCDKAAACADKVEELPGIVAQAIATDPSLSRALHGIESLKVQFEAFQADLHRLNQQQAEAVPVYLRLNRVADYFDELWAAGIQPKDFAGSVLAVLKASAATRQGDYAAAQRRLQTAVRQRPQDTALRELTHQVTMLATHPVKGRPPEPAPLQPGDTLDGWLLETRLGAGGWGQVFQANRKDQTRALKVMHPRFAADPAFVECFKAEIGALYGLPRHPNLVHIEDFGYCLTRQTWYLVMEYLDGPTLEQHLASKGPMTEESVRKVFPDLIEGLARAHVAGFVHRDIKPGNLISRLTDQRLVLVDFGLAVTVEQIGKTQLSGISVQFAAPEQYYGEPATRASDVFSLCAVIYYALNYDKPELRKPLYFMRDMVPGSWREVLTAGLQPSVQKRLHDAGQLLARSHPPPLLRRNPSRSSARPPTR